MVAPFILLPLYIYPSGSAWSHVYSQIQANPNLNFDVIVNVNNGPGSSAYNFPDSNWITGVSKLNSYSNTRLLGYVHTSWATREYTDVTDDIDAWASWASYSSADIHMDGIFFDESPSDDTTATLSFMKNATDYARNEMPNSQTSSITVVFNPGTTVSDDFYDIADYIVAYEDTYSDYTAASISAVASEARAKSAFLIYDFTGNSGRQATVVSNIVNAGIPAIYISTEDGYSSLSSYWSQFCTSMNNMVSGASSSSPSSSSSSVATSSSKTTSMPTTMTTSSSSVRTTSTKTSSTKTSSTKATSTKTTSTKAVAQSTTVTPTPTPTPTPASKQHKPKAHSVRRRTFWGLVGVEA